jgi:hypothetical protein
MLVRHFVSLLLTVAASCYGSVGHTQSNEAQLRLIPSESFSPEVGRWSPLVVDGQVIGLSVVSVGRLFTEIGLSHGDLVVTVNGKQLANEGIESAVEFSSLLVRRAPFELLVNRGATTLVVRYPGANEPRH